MTAPLQSHQATARTMAVAPRRWITPMRVLFAVAAVALYYGWHWPTERYLTPERGFGYALGIIGGSLMVLLLLYSARKRWHWLRPFGAMSRWFEVHIAFGILGPVCILYHSNFSLGATNSNVALFCMLTVAGSGFIGRYLYARVGIAHFKRLFSIWHLLHLPLVFMMFIAAIVHVIAVHVY